MTHLSLRGLRALALLGAILAVACAQVAQAAQTRAFVAATDFSSGSLANIQLDPPRTVTTNVASVSSDAALRTYSGLLYVVNRFGFDNIKVLDPATSFSTVQEFSVGNGSNPHDIALASPTKGYVTRYETPDLWIVNPQTGQHTGTISLAAFADADGIPEMDRMIIRDGKLFVSLQRLDRNNFFAPAGGSQIVVINTTTDAVIDADPGTSGTQGILLPFQNPFTELVADPSGQFVVGCLGNFVVADGGVVRIDPVTLTVAATEITESALGGDLNDVAPFTAQRGFVVISDPSFNTILKAYRRDLGTVQSTVYSTAGFNLADIEVNDRDELWVCDRTFSNPGVRVFDAVTGAQNTSSPLNVGLPPQDIAFDAATVTAVSPMTSRSAVTPEISAVVPNPFQSSATIHYTIPEAARGEDVRFTVVDAAGRIAFSTVLRDGAAGPRTFTWNGRDSHGQPAHAGVYFVTIASASGRATARIMLIR